MPALIPSVRGRILAVHHVDADPCLVASRVVDDAVGDAEEALDVLRRLVVSPHGPLLAPVGEAQGEEPRGAWGRGECDGPCRVEFKSFLPDVIEDSRTIVVISSESCLREAGRCRDGEKQGSREAHDCESVCLDGLLSMVRVWISLSLYTILLVNSASIHTVRSQ